MLESQLARLAADAARLRTRHLRDLIAEPGRAARFTHRAGPLLIDFSRERLDGSALETLGATAEDSRGSDARAAIFRGALITPSEHRPVLHPALRASESRLPILAPRSVF